VGNKPGKQAQNPAATHLSVYPNAALIAAALPKTISTPADTVLRDEASAILSDPDWMRREALMMACWSLEGGELGGWNLVIEVIEVIKIVIEVIEVRY
jgi:hypothetical protein